MAAKTVHPLEGATGIVKGELDPHSKFMKSVIGEVWGKEPPFSKTLPAAEQERVVRFALATPFGRSDMIERFGKDRVMELAKKYGIQMPGDMPDTGGQEADANG